MKYGCICGWIGSTTGDCPACLKKTLTHRAVFPIIPCHWCGTAKHVQVIGQNLFHCHQCDRTFDNDPNEGGSVATSDDPVRSAIQEEAMRMRVNPAKRHVPHHYS